MNELAIVTYGRLKNFVRFVVDFLYEIHVDKCVQICPRRVLPIDEYILLRLQAVDIRH